MFIVTCSFSEKGYTDLDDHSRIKLFVFPGGLGHKTFPQISGWIIFPTHVARSSIYLQCCSQSLLLLTMFSLVLIL